MRISQVIKLQLSTVIRLPTRLGLTQGHFIVGYQARIETHPRSLQKMLDPFDIPDFGVSQGPSNGLSPAKQGLTGAGGQISGTWRFSIITPIWFEFRIFLLLDWLPCHAFP